MYTCNTITYNEVGVYLTLNLLLITLLDTPTFSFFISCMTSFKSKVWSLLWSASSKIPRSHLGTKMY